MTKETDKSRRQMLKALGVVGLTTSAGGVVGLGLFGAAAQERTAPVGSPVQRQPLRTPTPAERPTPIPADDPVLLRAVSAAQNTQFGKRRVPLHLKSSTAHRFTHEFELPPALEKKAGRKTMPVEVIAVEISDPDSSKALHARLSELKMPDAQKPQAFYYIKARAAGKLRAGDEFNFVLGLFESGGQAAATIIRVDNLLKLPGWTITRGLVKGGPTGGTTPVESSAGQADEATEGEEGSHFVSCYIWVLELFLIGVSMYFGGFCSACLGALATLPVTAGASAAVSIPTCMVCAAALGAAFAAAAAVCFEMER